MTDRPTFAKWVRWLRVDGFEVTRGYSSWCLWKAFKKYKGVSDVVV